MKTKQLEMGFYMNALNTVLGIVASLFSIVTTVISLKTRADVKEIKNSYTNNSLTATGDKNKQVVGSGNRVN